MVEITTNQQTQPDKKAKTHKRVKADKQIKPRKKLKADKGITDSDLIGQNLIDINFIEKRLNADEQESRSQKEPVRLSDEEILVLQEQIRRDADERNRKRDRRRGGSGFFWKIVVIGVLLLALMFAVRFLFLDKFFTSYSSTSIITEQKLELCQELVTLKYKYKDVVVIAPENGFLKNTFSIVQFEGVIRVGIKDITESDIFVSEDGKSVKITLPFIEILGNDISAQELVKEMKSIFGSVSNTAVLNAINDERQKFLEEMIDDGIYEEARKNAEAVVRQLLISMGYENENIEIDCKVEPYMKDLPDLTTKDLEDAASNDLTMGE